MKDCPKCNAPVDGMRCNACGYAEPGAPEKTRHVSAEVERARAACAHYRPPDRSDIEQQAIDLYPSNGGKPGKWWAHRLVYRHEHGEHVSDFSLSSAYEALGIRQTIDEQETKHHD